MPTSGTSSTPRSASTWQRDGELARAAVDQHQVGPFGLGDRSLFLDQAREAARQHLAHHAVVVAGRELGRFDVELAVLAFSKPSGPGHDHAADRVGALDVRVVVDLDPLGRRVQAEGLRHAVQQFALRRVLRHAAAERLARVGQRHVDELALLAALRHRDLDLALGAQRQRLGEQLAFGDRLRTAGSGAGAVRSS